MLLKFGHPVVLHPRDQRNQRFNKLESRRSFAAQIIVVSRARDQAAGHDRDEPRMTRMRADTTGAAVGFIFSGR